MPAQLKDARIPPPAFPGGAATANCKTTKTDCAGTGFTIGRALSEAAKSSVHDSKSADVKLFYPTNPQLTDFLAGPKRTSREYGTARQRFKILA